MLFLLILAFSCLMFYNYYWKRRHLPPGPAPLPLLGNVFELNKNPPGYEAHCGWSREYGGIYTYWLSELPIVSISDFDLIQETFVKDGDTFAGRFTLEEFLTIFRGGKYGVVDTDGDLWRDQRRFTIHVLRDFGVGRNMMQEKVLAEVAEFLRHIEESPDGEVAVEHAFDVGVGSIIGSLLFGFRYEGEKLAEFRPFKTVLSDHLRLCVHPLMMLIALRPNFFKHFPVFSGLYNTIIRNRDTMYTYFDKQIAEHRERLATEEVTEPKDFVEAYLMEMMRQQESGEPTYFNDMQLRNVILDLFIAGQVSTPEQWKPKSLTDRGTSGSQPAETTTNTLTWSVLYILHNLHVQDGIHDELDRVVGSDRMVTMADKPKLPYINAVINESQRLTNLLPQNLMHRTTRDVVVKGHLIPKDTCILPQISCVLYDEKVFPEPYAFRPERFLDASGQLKRVDELIPFSIGKRQCLGEGLARMELFLFIANLFNTYKIAPSDSSNLPSIEKRAGITVSSHPYTCKILRRRK